MLLCLAVPPAAEVLGWSWGSGENGTGMRAERRSPVGVSRRMHSAEHSGAFALLKRGDVV